MLERAWSVLEAERVVKQVRNMYRLGVVSTFGLAVACGGGGHVNSDAAVADGPASDAATVDAAAPKEITSFAFLSADNPGLAADVTATISGTTIMADSTFPAVTALKATFTTTGTSVAIGDTVQVSGVTANDFTGVVTYTVTATDSSTKDYTV